MPIDYEAYEGRINTAHSSPYRPPPGFLYFIQDSFMAESLNEGDHVKSLCRLA
jgi:hypothetical protein